MDRPAPTPVSAPAPGALEWTVNPWRTNPARPLKALLLELAVAIAAGWSFSWPDWWPQAIGWGGISLLLLAGMTATIFLPVKYKLDAQGVTVYFLGAPSSRKWAHYRNYYSHETGVHLTTMPTPSGLDPFRGHYLQYGANGSGAEKAQVLEFIGRHLAEYRGKPAA